MLDRAASISGQLTNAALAPVDGGTVRLFRRIAGQWLAWSETSIESNGSYELDGLAPAAYRLEFDAAGSDLATEWWNDADDLASASDTVLSEGARVTRDAVLTRGATVSGRVRDQFGEPVQRAFVYVHRRDASGAWVRQRGFALTDDEGLFSYAGLSAGTYRLEFATDCGQFVPEFFGDSPTLSGATDVVVRSELADVAGLDATVELAGRIEGRVKAPGDVDYTGVYDNLVTAFRQVEGDWAPVASTRSVQGGVYELAGLPAGRYRLRFRDDKNLFWADEFWSETPAGSGARAVADGTDITVAAGAAVAGTDIELDPAVHAVRVPRLPASPKVGTPVRADPGAWSPSDVSLSYQWLANGRPIPGATGVRYLPTPSDLGKTLTLRVRGTRAGFVPSGATSAASGPVGRGAIRNLSRPKVQGTANVGNTLRLTPGTWSPGHVRLGYKWLADGQVVGRGARLTLTPGLRGARITARVTAKAVGYAPITARVRVTPTV